MLDRVVVGGNLRLLLAGTLLLAPTQTLSAATRHPVGVVDRAKLAWLACSLATVGGALGATVQTDEEVREAAYGCRPDRRLSGR